MSLKLVIIKIDRDDFGAMSFEQGKMKIEDVWNELKDGSAFSNEDEGWDACVDTVIDVPDKKTAELVLKGMGAASDIVGDYDAMKGTNWYAILVGEKK